MSDRNSDPLLDKLNPAQRQAVLHTEGPVLVLAGAGSGKTRVITHRIAWIIQRMGVPAWQILAMTFTNKAAGEMRERVGHVVGESARDLWLGTFHSIGVRLLRQGLATSCGLQTNFSIYDTDDQVKVVSRAMQALSISDATHKPKQIAGYIDRAKNRCLLPDDQRLIDEVDSPFDRNALRVYHAYEAEMRRANAVDFNDLILRPLQALASDEHILFNYSQKFRYVLVDEFQDTNQAQFELLKLLTSVHGNLCVVGDDDQSIYSWRGAQVDNILKFPERMPGTEVVMLEQNYRSSGHILQASNAMISANRSRHGKVLRTDAADGDKLTLHAAATERDEAAWVARRIERLHKEIPLKQMAIFYRTNALSRVLEEAMRLARLPYALIGGQRFYERAEIKDALSWCRLLVNPSDTAGWLRAVVSPRRGIGQVTLDAIAEFAQGRDLPMPLASRELLRLRQAGKATDKLKAFEELVDKLRQGIELLPAHEAGRRVIDQSGLYEALRKDKTPESEDRMENLKELLTAMEDFTEQAQDPSLRSFLEQVALVSDTDKLGGEVDRVSLMTMHAAKGLEYDVTFIVGLEEGLLPHSNVVNEQSDVRDLEEERRLFYVAMTRARHKLHLTYARSRRKFGAQEMATQPSRFLQQVPRNLVEIEGSTYGATGGWQTPAAGTMPMRRGPLPTGAWAQRPVSSPQPPKWQGGSEDDVPVLQRGEQHEPAPQGPLQVGSRVRHITFGSGRILVMDGPKPEDYLTVRFDQVGVKRLVARYVKPAS